MKTMEITVTVNGKKRTETVETRMLLSDFIREQLRLTGTHLGCEHGVCGACTVLVNGKAARSCLMLAVQADGFAIDTVESLAREDGSLHPLQQAFSDNHALQCGFCTPGFMMTLVDFLQENPNPSEGEIREAISGNLCRCTGYANIVKAVEQASQALAKQGG
ncbi:(2Fe-2S)-binding protein [Brevibacillus panacihumi]|uniref:(2Fe-2S)-binding protein n=1 Tax=Brevibacillus panacihumi TaxID=497735 RepID=A0A3M8CS48_9BACL|nr:(2Fe-2S)-binding protein [Brevibacillus panacihumi]RNB78616.1 (2Fe-2S)-binding protein [Brevibacillus panacihumi]